MPNAQTLPKIDDEQNWFLIEGTEDNGWTTLKFWRLLDTGDSSEDIVIGEVRIYSYVLLRYCVCSNVIETVEMHTGGEPLRIILK